MSYFAQGGLVYFGGKSMTDFFQPLKSSYHCSVTRTHSKFFNPDPSGYEDAGDYVTQIYCLARYAPLEKE